MTGIALASAVALPGVVIVAVGILALIALVLAPRIVTICALVAVASVGALRYIAWTSVAVDDISSLAPAGAARVDGYIASDPDVRSGRVSFRLNAIAADAHAAHFSVSGDVAVTVDLAEGGDLGVGDGDHVQLTGELYKPNSLANPGSGSWAEHLRRQGVHCALGVHHASSVNVLPGGRRNWFRHAAWDARAALLKSLRLILPRTDAAVLAGVLLGLRVDLPPQLLAAFVATGTIHILATAGLHVGILYKLLMDTLLGLTLHRKLAAIATIGGIWIYDLMAGGRMAVTRAAIMATIYLLAIVVERSPDVLNSLGTAAMAILIAEPTQLLEPGFQTSFGAVLVIASMMPIWARLWDESIHALRSVKGRHVARRGVELTGLTLFAQLGASPVLASAFNVVSMTGSVANLIVVPVLFYLIPAGLVVAIIGIWSTASAAPVAHVLLSPVIGFITATVNQFAKLPGAEIVVASPPLWAVISFYIGTSGLFLATERRLLRQRTRSEMEPE
jgi:competence protein ComEC